jgi:tetratricopeptide (TPR) repeat protein
LAVVILFLNRGGGGATDPAPPTQEEINQELGVLQQAFQTALQEKQDLTRLAAQARAFTEEHPETQGGYVLLAQTRMGLKQWDQAYKAWDKSLSFDQGAFELNKMAGLCAAKLGQVEQALRHYQRAVESDKADNEVFAALGRLHLSLNDVDSAEAMFKQAVDARAPGEKTNYRHEAYAGLADVSAVRGDIDTALSWIDRAIKMAKLDSSADSAGYHIQKARIYMDAGRDEDAVTMLGYTWSEFADAPWRIESARLRAKLYERANKIDNAANYVQTITEYHRMSETRDKETLANFTALLADWQLKAGRTEDAKISLHNLQTLAPEHPAIDGLKARLR